ITCAGFEHAPPSSDGNSCAEIARKGCRNSPPPNPPRWKGEILRGKGTELPRLPIRRQTAPGADDYYLGPTQAAPPPRQCRGPGCGPGGEGHGQGKSTPSQSP